MPNEIFRNRIINNINYAIQEAKDAINANHPGLEGRIREIAVSNLFKPLLMEGISLGTGKIVDSKGNSSRQSDVIIYSKKILSSTMYNQNEGNFPIETCAFSIEVKSKTSATNISDAINKAKELDKLFYLPGIFKGDEPIQTSNPQRVVRSIFAFDSDLSVDGKTEWERYINLDGKNPDLIPSVQQICVVGRGYWDWTESSKHWSYRASSQEHDEVITFLSVIINSIPEILATRGKPRMGNYLMRN